LKHIFVAWGSGQVTSEWKVRSVEPGMEISQKEKDTLEQNMRAFFAPLPQDGQNVRSRKAIYKAPERVASLRLGRTLENISKWGLNRRWWQYIVTPEKVVLICGKVDDGTLTWETLEQHVPGIVMVDDKDSKNVAWQGFAIFEMQCNIFEFWDGPGHGLANVILNGLNHAGKATDVNKMAILRNFRSAPFQSGAWFRKLQGLSLELAVTVSRQDRFARFSFAMVKFDRGLPLNEEDEEAFEEWLGGLGDDKETQCKGENLRKANWGDINRKGSALLEGWGTGCSSSGTSTSSWVRSAR
jgi:hypothetical protein